MKRTLKRISTRHAEVLRWLREKPDAVLHVDWIGKEIVRAEVVWTGMPMQMHPDEVVEDFHVEPKLAKSLVVNRLVRESRKHNRGFVRFYMQRSVYGNGYLPAMEANR